MSKIVFIDCTPEIEPVWTSVLAADDPAIDVRLSGALEDRAVPAAVSGYDTAIVDATYFTAATLEKCSGLKHIVFLGTGAGSYIDLAAAEGLGIKVSNIRGYGDTTVAEHAMGLVFAAARHIAAMHEQIRRGTWRPLQGMELKGKTLGLIGLGGIGREMARIGRGVGFNVIAYNRRPVAVDGVAMMAIEDVLARSDIVSLHLALNDETRHFLDAARLALCKPGAIVVNTARAGVVEEAALVALLRQGRVGHYATDVFATEPVPADSPLLALETVTLTAHAGYNTPEAARALYRLAIDRAAGG